MGMFIIGAASHFVRYIVFPKESHFLLQKRHVKVLGLMVKRRRILSLDM